MTKLTNVVNKTLNFNVKGVPWMALFSMLLVTLKAFGKFPFEWIWTLAPLWGPAVISIGILFAIIGIAGIVCAVIFLGIIALEGFQNLRYRYHRRKSAKAAKKARDREQEAEDKRSGVKP